ncbi:hypothetical protein [Polymorphospora lycopeni]|uniref:Uncharacterized protein n=1 Tax=Polymorphospora lycopeni TaxID=3140240 RepID=A0ABV5CL00_9ACTN
MPVASSDILLKLSAPPASAGNTAAGVVGQSLGKYAATTEVPDGGLHGLFPKVTGSQNAASQVDYACVFVHNAHATDPLSGAVVYLPTQVSGGTTVAVGVDPTAASAIGSSTAQAVTISTPTTAPAGVTFSAPTDASSGLALGDLPSGQCRAIWIRRAAANTSALVGDGVTIAVTGDNL